MPDIPDNDAAAGGKVTSLSPSLPQEWLRLAALAQDSAALLHWLRH